MEKKIFNCDELTRVGPYSHAVEANGLIFVSGMIPMDKETKKVIEDDVTAAAELVFENMKKALAAAGLSLGNVIKTTVFLKDMADFPALNEVYKRYFTENEPARSTVAVKSLPLNVPVEIEVVAAR